MILPRLPIAEYIADQVGLDVPTLSASAAHTLLSKSPRHCWHGHPRLNPAWEREDSEQAEIGTLAHSLLLEGDQSRLVIVEADDWRTKAAREKRDAARAGGKLPVLEHKAADVIQMVATACLAIQASELRPEWSTGKVEQTLIWQEGETWCRCRPDWMSKDGRILLDFKTTGGTAEPDAFSRGMLLAMGYDMQAAFGLRAVKALVKPRECSFVFMVQETDPPYAVSFIGLSPLWEDFADRKMAAALTSWRACLDSGEWPGYPPRICWAEPPAFGVQRFEERAAFASNEQGVDQL